jgi:hypothetical protein
MFSSTVVLRSGAVAQEAARSASVTAMCLNMIRPCACACAWQ